MEGAAVLKETKKVPWDFVKSRETLHGSLQQLMYGSVRQEDSYKELTEANDLRGKLEFIQAIVEDWITGGGLGCLGDLKDYEWRGVQPVTDRKRHDWASVGRYGGDVFS
jgi:myosin-1